MSFENAYANIRRHLRSAIAEGRNSREQIDLEWLCPMIKSYLREARDASSVSAQVAVVNQAVKILSSIKAMCCESASPEGCLRQLEASEMDLRALAVSLWGAGRVQTLERDWDEKQAYYDCKQACRVKTRGGPASSREACFAECEVPSKIYRML